MKANRFKGILYFIAIAIVYVALSMMLSGLISHAASYIRRSINSSTYVDIVTISDANKTLLVNGDTEYSTTINHNGMEYKDYSEDTYSKTYWRVGDKVNAKITVDNNGYIWKLKIYL